MTVEELVGYFRRYQFHHQSTLKDATHCSMTFRDRHAKPHSFVFPVGATPEELARYAREFLERQGFDLPDQEQG